MTTGPTQGPPPRTVLEQKIRERRQTFDDFVRFAETFARQHNEPATLSVRHLRRLVSGRGDGGKPLGRPNQVTARLLEKIFNLTIEELLSSPTNVASSNRDDRDQLHEMLRASARVDQSVLNVLRQQLTATRRLDRQLGAIVAHDEVTTKIRQVSRLLDHSLVPVTRERLAALLSELCALSGWQALDMGEKAASWQYYEKSKIAANELENPAFRALSMAGHAFVLIDLGDADSATELLTETRAQTERCVDNLTRSWLAAAHGEALAAAGRRSGSLRAFDRADSLLPANASSVDGPYVALNGVHLGRWRGHALARFGEPEAIDVLSSALGNLDSTFTRAEAALQVDLATAFLATGEPEQAEAHISRAAALATDIGSSRQQRRILQIKADLIS